MSEPSYDANDVSNAASDLVGLGGTISATHFDDSITQLQFSSIVSYYANKVIKDVNDGVISAWDGLQAIRAEYAGLSSKVFFYAQNGIGVVAGSLQVEAGVAITGASYGVGAPLGAFFVAHGVNNLYEGGMNIYNGPAAPTAQGPTRRAYQTFMRDDYDGDMAYGTIDLLLSAGGMMRPIRKMGSVELFRQDPLNYESAYQQTSKLALFFEALVDSITINTMISEERAEIESNKKQHHNQQ